MTEFNTRFDVDYAGWARANARRPITHLVREVVSNAFDAEGVTTVVVEVIGRMVSVEDDAPEGVRDVKHLTTIFSSTSNTDETKRGRKGRGFKEFVGAASLATIDTVGCSISFEEGRTESENTRTRGTKVTGLFADVDIDTDKMLQYLTSFVPPKGVEFTVNGLKPTPYEVVMEVPVTSIPSIDSEGFPSQVIAQVQILKREPGTESQLYELGIPVCDNLYQAYSMNVLCKLPLNDDRTGLAVNAHAQLLANTLNEYPNLLNLEDLSNTSVMDALLDIELSREMTSRMRLLLYIDKPEMVLSNDLDYYDTAQKEALVNAGYTVRDMGVTLRRLSKRFGVDTATSKLEDMRRSSKPVPVSASVVDPHMRFQSLMMHASHAMTGESLKSTILFAKASNPLQEYEMLSVYRTPEGIVFKISREVNYNDILSADCMSQLLKGCAEVCSMAGIQFVTAKMMSYLASNGEYIRSISKRR
jgi:hypothetical protein